MSRIPERRKPVTPVPPQTTDELLGASANGSAPVSATESASANVSASADVPEQFSVRVRPSTKRAIDGYIHGAKLKKGPATDALWQLLMRGAIDVKVVRDEIRKMKGDE